MHLIGIFFSVFDIISPERLLETLKMFMLYKYDLGNGGKKETIGARNKKLVTLFKNSIFFL